MMMTTTIIKMDHGMSMTITVDGEERIQYQKI